MLRTGSYINIKKSDGNNSGKTFSHDVSRATLPRHRLRHSPLSSFSPHEGDPPLNLASSLEDDRHVQCFFKRASIMYSVLSLSPTKSCSSDYHVPRRED